MYQTTEQAMEELLTCIEGNWGWNLSATGTAYHNTYTGARLGGSVLINHDGCFFAIMCRGRGRYEEPVAFERAIDALRYVERNCDF